VTVPDFDSLPRAGGLDGRVLRDLLALILVLAGLAGLAVAAYHVSPFLALALVSAAVLAAGLALGVDR
jgi:hypothetical protein